MEAIKKPIKIKHKDAKRLRLFFIKGMSEILVIGKKPKIQKFNNYSEALNHDIGFLQEDLVEALIKLIEDLPKEKKIELKNKILNFESNDVWNSLANDFNNDIG